MIAAATIPASRLAKKNETLKLKLDNLVLERRIKALTTSGRYDAVETNKNRRQPTIEIKSEDQVLEPRKRLLSHNIGRDLERNFASARGLIHQFRVNVVGADGKMQINTPDGEAASKWFNEVFSKSCDYRDDLHWSTILQNVVAAAIREGDLLVVFDDEITPEDSGKLIHFEADQIASVSENLLKQLPGYEAGWTQDSGVVRDQLGKVVGYIATGKRGKTIIETLDEATFFPRSIARLVKNPWRLNQGRGVSAMLTAATNFQDLYEILAKELQSAKVAASIAGWTERQDAVMDYDNPAGLAQFLPENNGKAAADTALEGANSTDTTAPNYERFEALTGGIWEYLAKGDKINFANIDRPNVHLAEFIEAVLGHAGASMGLARAYTILRADSSYTAFRGDMVLSWATFYMLQKWLERDYADWVAVRAIGWAIRNGQVPAMAPGWERAISWSWPKMPNVDELKEESAIKQALKNGTTDFSKQLGPDWRKKLEAFSEQVNEIRRLNLPLSILETIGGVTEPTGNNENQGNANEQN